MAAAHSQVAISLARSNLRQVSRVNATTLQIGKTGIPAYILDPDFVREIKGAPAGVLDYIAVTAAAPQGTAVTMQVVPDRSGGWHVRSVISGTDEVQLRKQISPDDVLLFEPQINGWYDLGAGKVRLLRASLPQQPVGQWVSLAIYQKQVHSRYADKLPGSTYQRQGKIGFTQHSTQADHPRSSAHSGLRLGVEIGVAAIVAVLCLCSAAIIMRRRRKAPA